MKRHLAKLLNQKGESPEELSAMILNDISRHAVRFRWLLTFLLALMVQVPLAAQDSSIARFERDIELERVFPGAATLSLEAADARHASVLNSAGDPPKPQNPILVFQRPNREGRVFERQIMERRRGF